MPQPIYLPKERSPFESLLPMVQQMFMMKFKHKMDMDIVDAETKRKAAEKTEQRSYEQKQKGQTQKQKFVTAGRKPIVGPRVQQPGEVTNVYTGNRWGQKPRPQAITVDGVKLIETSPGKYIKAAGTETPTKMRNFELTIYGKEVPEMRGTSEYIDRRLKWIEQQKEMSPYTKQIARQNEITAKREGTSLRKEFNTLPEVKDYSEIRKRYSVMEEAMKESKTTNTFVAVDQALITTFNKITDPDSVVRESEYARTAEDLSLVARARAAVSRVAKGGRLDQQGREALHRMAGKFMNITQQRYDDRLKEYKGYFMGYGLDPERYLKPITSPLRGVSESTTSPQDLSTMSDEELKTLYRNMSSGS